MTPGVFLCWVPQPILGAAVVTDNFMDCVLRWMQVDGNPVLGGRQVGNGYIHENLGYLPDSRNALVRYFLDVDADQAEWLVMLDWDVTFTAADVYALLDAADPVERPIVSGCYVTWIEGALRPCWTVEKPGREFAPVSELKIGELTPLTTPGLGMTLFHRSALERMRAAAADPRDPWTWFGHDLYRDPSRGWRRLGEDTTFSRRARAAGVPIWGHAGVLLGHIKAKELHPTDLLDSPAAEPRSAKRLLNVGGMSKSIALPARYRGWDHVLLDVEPGPDVDIVADARAIPSYAGEFDAVYLSHVLEHFDQGDAALVLGQARGVLRPGGAIEVVVPDGDAVEELAARIGMDGTAYMSDVGPVSPRMMVEGLPGAGERMRHRQVFTADAMLAALLGAGFSDVTLGKIPDAYSLVAHATAHPAAPETEDNPGADK